MQFRICIRVRNNTMNVLWLVSHQVSSQMGKILLSKHCEPFFHTVPWCSYWHVVLVLLCFLLVPLWRERERKTLVLVTNKTTTHVPPVSSDPFVKKREKRFGVRHIPLLHQSFVETQCPVLFPKPIQLS